MTYNNLYKEFKEIIPEGMEFYQRREKELCIDEMDGTHIFFGMIVVPYILYSVQNEETSVIKRIFQFLENMATCNDVKINEVLDFTVLEQLVDEEKEILEQCKPYMGSYTLMQCKKIEEYIL